MSTKLSLKEVLERGDVTWASVPRDSTSRTVKLLLTSGGSDRLVSVARLLWRKGLSLKAAHAAIDRLAAGEYVVVEAATDDPEALIAELGQLSVHATAVEDVEALEV